jgi:predicted RNA-binding Zn-ribbon protein involved in translation (DUF1610 family)
MNQTWFISGRTFGPYLAHPLYIKGELHPPRSYAYFCPVCGDVWARRIISPDTRWLAWSFRCPKHPDAPFWHTVPGSIIPSFLFEELWHDLPLPLKQREALLHLDATLT